MKRRLLVSSILLAALAGCGRGGSDTAAGNVATDTNMVEVTGSPASTGAYGPGLVSTPNFVAQAAISDMYEIQAAKLAVDRSQSADIKAFARMMIADHGATSAKLKGLLATSGVAAAPPAALDPSHAAMIEALQQAEPGKFDEVYLDQQTQAHRAALGLMESYAANGDNPALKTFAADTRPKIQMHLDRVAKLDHGGADESKPAEAGNAS